MKKILYWKATKNFYAKKIINSNLFAGFLAISEGSLTQGIPLEKVYLLNPPNAITFEYDFELVVEVIGILRLHG